MSLAGRRAREARMAERLLSIAVGRFRRYLDRMARRPELAVAYAGAQGMLSLGFSCQVKASTLLWAAALAAAEQVNSSAPRGFKIDYGVYSDRKDRYIVEFSILPPSFGLPLPLIERVVVTKEMLTPLVESLRVMNYAKCTLLPGMLTIESGPVVDEVLRVYGGDYEMIETMLALGLGKDDIEEYEKEVEGKEPPSTPLDIYTPKGAMRIETMTRAEVARRLGVPLARKPHSKTRAWADTSLRRLFKLYVVVPALAETPMGITIGGVVTYVITRRPDLKLKAEILI